MKEYSQCASYATDCTYRIAAQLLWELVSMTITLQTVFSQQRCLLRPLVAHERWVRAKAMTSRL